MYMNMYACIEVNRSTIPLLLLTDSFVFTGTFNPHCLLLPGQRAPSLDICIYAYIYIYLCTCICIMYACIEISPSTIPSLPLTDSFYFYRYILSS